MEELKKASKHHKGFWVNYHYYDINKKKPKFNTLVYIKYLNIQTLLVFTNLI